MKLYEVEVTTTIVRTIAVNAYNHDDAIERAMEIPYSHMDWDERETVDDIYVQETHYDET